jgi:hypothetical protein
MMGLRNWFLVLISAAASAQAAPPLRLEIAYELARNGSKVAEVVERLEHNNGSYKLTESWRGKGLYLLRGEVKRSSRGLIGPEGLKPLAFSDQRTGRKPASASFDWSAKTLTLQYKGEPRTVPLPENAQDRLSYLLSFAFRPPPAGEFTVHLTDGRGISSHVYLLAGRERVSTPAGEFDTVKLVRRNGGDLSREMWLATEHSHLPVRVLIVDKDGTRFEQVATRISEP